jgi:predicted metal-dependent hydrolase
MNHAEQSIVQFGRTSISYWIERGQRHRTVAIAVDPERGIRVRAPQGTPVTRLDHIVRLKAKWIINKRRQHEDLPPRPTPREFVNGETFLYAGRQYRLKLVPSAECTDQRVRLVGARMHVCAGARIRQFIVAWYRQRAEECIDSRMHVWAERLNAFPRRVSVREQRARWGSADVRGNLRFNWRIVQAPTRLLDYVIAHELVHLLHHDHTREFWSTLGRVMPDYEARRERLRVIGRVMVW